MLNLSHMRFPKSFRALLMLILLAMAARPLSAGKSEERLAAQMEGRAAALEERLTAQAFTTEVSAITAMEDEDLVERFASFRHHAHDASRLNYKVQTVDPPEDAVNLSNDMVALIKAVLKTPDELSGASLRATLLVRIPREKMWRVLEALEIGKKFDAAAGLSKLLLESESNETKEDLLSLIAARNSWLNNAEEMAPAGSFSLAEAASGSEDETIAYHANLWMEAIQAPRRIEAVNLAFQLWETVMLDKGYREQGAMVSHHLCKNMDAALAAIQILELDQSVEETQIARLASIGAEMGHQRMDPARIAWAQNLVEGLSNGDPEDRLAPDYFHAIDELARGRMAEAAEAADPIFFSEIECDISADAGRIIAETLMHADDDMAALATYELLRELYPNQPYVFEDIHVRESFLKDKLKD